MSEQVKLVIAKEQGGQEHQFVIYVNQILGQGGFGVVKKAYQKNFPEKELVVKIIPYIDEIKQEKIDKEIQIIRTLPSHPNLIGVKPLKCFSAKNYYIFMECCRDGTLQDRMRKQNFFTQEEVFDFFYQFMNGYKVLYDRKILHQDIKPDNVLIKGNTYKITDFGFSIFHEGHKYGNIRQGTLPYMPLEKLTEKQIYANTKIDVYALGVILFKMITGNHPWVKSKVNNYKEYLKELRANKTLFFKPGMLKNCSIKFQHFFELVLRMVAKREENRVDFGQLYQYIETQQLFDKMRSREKEQTIKIQVKENNFKHIKETSNAVAIPFDIPRISEEEMKSKARETLLQQKMEENRIIVAKLDDYLIAHRIIIYFFDRLTRRVYIERLKRKLLEKQPSINDSNQLKAILALLLFCRKLVRGVIRETKSPSVFSQEEWRFYRREENNLLGIIVKDEAYLDDLVIDALSESSQMKIKEHKQLIELSNQSVQVFSPIVLNLLQELLKSRLDLMKTNNRASIITVKYILDGIQILKNLNGWIEKALELEAYFRQVETLEQTEILSRVLIELNAVEYDFILDFGQIDPNQMKAQVQKRNKLYKVDKEIEKKEEQLEDRPKEKSEDRPKEKLEDQIN